MQFLFTPDQPSAGRSTRFAGSVVVHLAVVGLIVVLSKVVLYPDEQVDWSRFRVEPAPMRLTEPVFFNAPAKAGAAGAQAKLAHATSKPGLTIVGPDYLPNARLPKTAPPVIHWSSARPTPPKVEIIAPGTTEPAAPPKLTAPPSLARPNRETTVASTNISLPPAPAQAKPALPVANGATAPIQTADSGPSRAASFDTAAGQPVNIMALGEDRSARRFVEIPIGLQNVPSADGSGAVPGAGSGNSSNPASSGTGSGSSTGSGKTGNANSASGSTSGAAAPSAVLVAGSSSSSPSNASAAAASTGRATDPAEVTRIQHPSNGAFDVVVAQSASRDDRPTTFRLAGAPVYTVYLPVGDKQEWLLEFAAPASSANAANPYQITIGNDAPIVPPYPITTAIPKRTAGRQTGPTVLRASLTSSGVFRDVRSSDSAPFTDALVQLIGQWKFRPATRNKEPIDVEVLLIIPN